ncbi:EamA domain [Sesbania bispinosa]|nr:EamA domain [Sesbania bispinosa]
MEKKNMWDTWAPALLMVAVQIIFSACNVIYKLAINDGMSTIVIAAYRMAFAALTIIPLALIFESGALFQNLFYGALVLTSATIVSAIYNLIPTMTFILAVSFGKVVCISFNENFEKLNWGATTGKAKVVGTLLGLVGAMLLTFYKGVEFDIWPFDINLLDPQQNSIGDVADTSSELLGALCVVVSCLCFSLWLIIQAKISVEYPCPMSSTALMSTLGAIQCFIFGFIVETDLNEWKLDWDIRLLTVTFSGILASGLMILVMAWCVKTKGPLFTSAFNPLMLLIVAVAASMLLDEKLNLGSVLGGVLIVCGLYTVLWGKNREAQNKTLLEPSEITVDSEVTRPLLDP